MEIPLSYTPPVREAKTHANDRPEAHVRLDVFRICREQLAQSGQTSSLDHDWPRALRLAAFCV
jgi:hypothetical protein